MLLKNKTLMESLISLLKMFGIWSVRNLKTPGRPGPDMMSKLALADPNQILNFSAGPEE